MGLRALPAPQDRRLFATGEPFAVLKHVQVHVVAHVTLGCGAQGLVVPRVIGTVAQGFVDDPAAGLGFADGGVIGGQVPAGVGHLAEAGEGRCMGGVGGKVRAFRRVGVEVVKHLGVGHAADVFPRAFAQGDHRGDGAFGGVFHAHGGGAVEAAGEGDEVFAIGPRHHLGHVDPCEGGEGRCHVDGRDGRVDAACGQAGGGAAGGDQAADAKFTEALTPGIALRLRSTELTHALHVIPDTAYVAGTKVALERSISGRGSALGSL
mgnify:CR=1 FL=1